MLDVSSPEEFRAGAECIFSCYLRYHNGESGNHECEYLNAEFFNDHISIRLFQDFDLSNAFSIGKPQEHPAGPVLPMELSCQEALKGYGSYDRILKIIF